MRSMNVRMLNRQKPNLASPRIFRIVAGLLVFSMFVNGFVPRFTLTGNSYSVITSVLASHSVLLQYFSLSVLPLKIVDTMFKERASNPLPHSPKKQNERGANSSSDYSLVSCDKRLSQSRHDFKHSPLSGMEMITAGISSFTPEACLPGDRASPIPVVFVSLLLFFFLLPRSSVNEDAVTVPCRIRSKTRRY